MLLVLCVILMFQMLIKCLLCDFICVKLLLVTRVYLQTTKGSGQSIWIRYQDTRCRKGDKYV